MRQTNGKTAGANIAQPGSLERAVAEYRKAYCLSARPHALITDIVQWSPTPAKEVSASPGCYAVLKFGDEPDLRLATDLTVELVYIGKTARRHLWQRLHERRRKLLAVLGRAGQIQMFPVEHWWEASSLEDFLIERFDPPWNKQGALKPWNDDE